MQAIEPRSRGLVFHRPAVYGWWMPPRRGFSARFNGLTSFMRISYGAGALLLTHYTSCDSAASCLQTVAPLQRSGPVWDPPPGTEKCRPGKFSGNPTWRRSVYQVTPTSRQRK